jgi:hypothetical protein
MREKDKITFLDLVLPFCSVYIAFLLIFTYFGKTHNGSSVMDMLVIFTSSAFFMYGIMAFLRDLKLFGFKWMLTSWRKLFK